MLMKSTLYKLLTVIVMVSPIPEVLGDSPTSPPVNPYMAQGPYPITHFDVTASGFSSNPGFTSNSSRALDPSEITFKPLGFANGFGYLYSAPYADGSLAIWAGGADKIVKLDASNLEELSVYAFGAGNLVTDLQVERFYDEVDALVAEAERDPAQIQSVFDRISETMVPALQRGSGAIYKLVSSDNELYITTRDKNTGEITITVYGDSTPGDKWSAIAVKRTFTLPEREGVIAQPMAMTMTYDGWIISVTNDGRLFAISRDFSKVHQLTLPEASNADGQSGEWMGGVIRNTVAVDDKGGIYVVARNFFHRVQWTGDALSLKAEDGGWTVPYNSGENGSGTTATPFGWGETEDHLVVIMDGVDAVNVYWRDEIPDDWQGIPGHPRRLAGTLPMTFGDNTPESFRIEASPVAAGYGFFWPNDTPRNQPPWQGAFNKQLFANYSGVMFEQHAVAGGVKYQWNPKSRQLELAWVSDLSLAPTLCTPNINGLLYCMGRRDGQYALEVLDWGTGQPAFHYLLGKSYRFNAAAAPNRIVDDYLEYSSTGNGILRIHPK
jgi:hypothetical protein